MTTDELFALGLERTQTLARMIEYSRTWYLGRRLRRPDELLSGYFEPKKGLGIDYFRQTIRHLTKGGFKKVNMKSSAAVAFRRGNEHVLTMLKEMEPILAQHVSKEDAAAFRLAVFFFRSGQDMFFDVLPRFEPIVRSTIQTLKVEAFCIDSLQRYLGDVARAFAIREAQLTGQPLALPAQKGRPLAMPAGLGTFAQLLGLPGEGFNRRCVAYADLRPVTKTAESKGGGEREPSRRRAGVSVVAGRGAHPAIDVKSGEWITVFDKERREQRYFIGGENSWIVLNRFLSSLKQHDDHSANHFPVDFNSDEYSATRDYFRAFVDTYVERQPAAVKRAHKLYEAKARIRIELLGDPTKDARIGGITDATVAPKKCRERA